MDLIDLQQEIADDILTRCSGYIHNMILAGGAPRDWYLDRPATDLDFYYHGHQSYQNKKPHAIISELLGIELVEKGATKNPNVVSVTATFSTNAPAAWQVPVMTTAPEPEGTVGVANLLWHNGQVVFSMESTSDDGYYKSNPDIMSVYEGEYRGTKVQFMSCKDSPRSVVAKFPFNVCHIYWTLEDGLCPMEDFVYGADNKVLIQEFHGYSNKTTYTEKIKKKFPDWVFIDKTKQKGTSLDDDEW